MTNERGRRRNETYDHVSRETKKRTSTEDSKEDTKVKIRTLKTSTRPPGTKENPGEEEEDDDEDDEQEEEEGPEREENGMAWR